MAGPVSLGYLSSGWGAVWSLALYPLEKRAALARLVTARRMASSSRRMAIDEERLTRIDWTRLREGGVADAG